MSGEQDPTFQSPEPQERRRIVRGTRDALTPQRVPPPPSARVRNPIVMVGNAIFTGLLLLIMAAGGLFYFGKQKLQAPGPLERDRSVVIESRKGVRDIADTLKRDGVIDQTLPFIAGAKLLGIGDELKAGEYLFEAHISMAKVLQTMVEGRSVQYSVTIPEGLTSQQIVQRLKDSAVLTGDITTVPAEGTLLPETYKVTRGWTREQILQRMSAAHKRLVDEIWAKRAPDLPIKTQAEFVTLASIVEKETGKADERARVAGVFVNRLRKRMRLQSDPTIVYGLMGGKGPLGRPLLKVEMDEPNPYNTYQIDGLPPGPIANPGRASLEATAHPMKTNELYFVADGTGGHVFAETLDEHAKNVAHWRNIERQNAAQPAPAPAPSPAPEPQPEIAQPVSPPVPAAAPEAPKAAGPLTSPRTHIAPKKKSEKKSEKKKQAPKSTQKEAPKE
jgi:UPF0755 protein